jgi:hypothetical protein
MITLLVAAPVHAAKLEGQRFDDTLQLSDRTLRLNGLGLRGVAWIKAFVVGLYLPAQSTDTQQILTMPGPKRLQLRMLMEAPSKELSKAFRRGVSKNETSKAQAALTGRVDVFNRAVDTIGTVKKGDSLDLDYLPGQGTQLRWNGKVLGPIIQGEDFYQSLLKIFIGEKPVDPRLKESLLRGR